MMKGVVFLLLVPAICFAQFDARILPEICGPDKFLTTVDIGGGVIKWDCVAVSPGGDPTLAGDVDGPGSSNDLDEVAVETELESVLDLNQLQGTLDDAKLTSDYSGAGVCSASTWASTLNDNAAPTCTQPSFANISGLLALAQITDDSSSGLCLLSGGGGGDPAWTTCPGGGAPLIVEEADGTPTVSSVDTIQFDSADGLTVTDESGGNVQVDLTLAGDVDGSGGSNDLDEAAVESELEAVLDLDQLQGQISDTQIADGAVDGGSAGEIADGSITKEDLGAASVEWASEIADDLGCSGNQAVRRNAGDSAWECFSPAAGGGPTRVSQTSTVSTTSSSVYSALSGLSISVSASTNYHIACRLLTTTAIGTTTGLQLQVQGPASPTEITIARRYYNNSTTALTVLTSTAFQSSSTDDAAAGSCSTSRCINEVDIFLVNAGNAGTIAFAIQSEVNTSNVSVFRGSYCDWRTF